MARLLLSSFRAQRSGDPEQGGARERETVADTARGWIAFASLRRRPVPGLRRKRASARNDEGGRQGLQRFLGGFGLIVVALSMVLCAEGPLTLPFVIPGEGERSEPQTRNKAAPERSGGESPQGGASAPVNSQRARDRFALSRAALFRVFAALRPE